jgi:hypothetical protein
VGRAGFAVGASTVDVCALRRAALKSITAADTLKRQIRQEFCFGLLQFGSGDNCAFPLSGKASIARWGVDRG